MNGQNFGGKSVKEYFKARGVIFADQRKADLGFLCEKAEEIGIKVDPNGLLEDRNEVLKEKLSLNDDSYLLVPSPDSIDSTQDLSILPPFGIFDLYNYLITFDQYDHSSLRKYNKMEAFGIFEDGYVLTIGSCKLNEDYVRVKPRTNYIK